MTGPNTYIVDACLLRMDQLDCVAVMRRRRHRIARLKRLAFLYEDRGRLHKLHFALFRLRRIDVK